MVDRFLEMKMIDRLKYFRGIGHGSFTIQRCKRDRRWIIANSKWCSSFLHISTFNYALHPVWRTLFVFHRAVALWTYAMTDISGLNSRDPKKGCEKWLPPIFWRSYTIFETNFFVYLNRRLFELLQSTWLSDLIPTTSVIRLNKKINNNTWKWNFLLL